MSSDMLVDAGALVITFTLMSVGSCPSGVHDLMTEYHQSIRLLAVKAYFCSLSLVSTV